jgi:hypothetical protein
MLRYNLDVMHIEKNMTDNVFAKLKMTGETERNLKPRLDLQEVSLINYLHLV